jgi:dienelactone hydrolase
MSMKFFAFSVMLLCTSLALAQAPKIPVDPSLGESIVFVKNENKWGIDLETTLFKPDGAGPFPVAVINHGKAPGGSNRFQPRYRPIPAVRELLQRGYAVVVPMRQGFSNSGGTTVGDSCNIGGNGEAQAEDVAAIVGWIKKQSWADSSRMLMMGQSHGGLTTLAYAQNPDPGFKVFVNFAGGLKLTNCNWEAALKIAYGRFGASTKVESIWFYGENESFFPPQAIGPAYKAYVDAGGKAEMVAFGVFGSDAHGMFGSYDGLPIWLKRVETRMTVAGLPTQIVNPKYVYVQTERPAPWGFAEISNMDKLPNLNDAMKTAYQRFLASAPPRAFALDAQGLTGFAFGGDDPLKRALEFCNRKGKGDCKLYAVDNDVVWLEEVKY